MGKRILKHAILGLLSKKDMSGYDITGEFKEEIGQFWSAKHSQIYIELKKLLSENLISQYIEISGEKLERKMYSLTSDGKNELDQWLTVPEDTIETEKDVFILKLYFINHIPKDRIEALFSNQYNIRSAKLTYLREQYQHFFGEQHPLEIASDQLGQYLVLTKAISREKSYIDWLSQSLELIRKRK
ncbi:PadR family transcriptional regulator [Paenibacillus chibensis]|uniref:PadR family transcriptional regulator n=1 Tax=Paenibacillus chibensis TaxID=59846 RepID=A0ABU6PX67_9BACL|nr:PadR family transcriptional regulator [Paenibacillus chibensis]